MGQANLDPTHFAVIWANSQLSKPFRRACTQKAQLNGFSWPLTIGLGPFQPRKRPGLSMFSPLCLWSCLHKPLPYVIFICIKLCIFISVNWSHAGSHTIGLSRCISFRDRIYNDTNIDSAFAAKLQKKCPRVGRDNRLFPLDKATRQHFDNCYYKNLLTEMGLLHSDQVLTNSSFTLSLVNKYASRSSTFFKDFAKSMVKMGNIKPLTGCKGEIRTNCRKVNWDIWDVCIHIFMKFMFMFPTCCIATSCCDNSQATRQM